MFRELRDIPTVGQYQLRRSGLLAQIRHPILDMWVLEEIFRFRVYEPPPPINDLLAAFARPIRVLDLGAHIGCFGLFTRELFPDARVVSFEPDPGNATMLRRCVEANELQHRWQVIEACAATGDGTTELCSSFHFSKVAGGSDPALHELQDGITRVFPFLDGTALVRSERLEVPCRDVFPFLHDADLIKVDIEGGEWELLADPRFEDLEAAAIVLEYHPAYTGDPNAEGTAQRRLERAGYVTGFSSRGPDAGLLWAWKATPAAA